MVFMCEGCTCSFEKKTLDSILGIEFYESCPRLEYYVIQNKINKNIKSEKEMYEYLNDVLGKITSSALNYITEDYSVLFLGDEKFRKNCFDKSLDLCTFYSNDGKNLNELLNRLNYLSPKADRIKHSKLWNIQYERIKKIKKQYFEKYPLLNEIYKFNYYRNALLNGSKYYEKAINKKNKEEEYKIIKTKNYEIFLICGENKLVKTYFDELYK
jgi:hypothetical protein